MFKLKCGIIKRILVCDKEEVPGWWRKLVRTEEKSTIHVVFVSVKRGLPVASCSQFSDNSCVSVVSQAAVDQSISCSPRSLIRCNIYVPGYRGRTDRVQGTLVRCGAAQWVKLSESWPKFKVADFQLKLLYITQNKFISVNNINMYSDI